jgi:hypothetical protein
MPGRWRPCVARVGSEARRLCSGGSRRADAEIRLDASTVRPIRDVRPSQPDHQIPQRRRVKQARIVGDREARHLIPETQFPSLGRKLICGIGSQLIEPFAIGH